jgi:uncharacterized protein (DUF952 family)
VGEEGQRLVPVQPGRGQVQDGLEDDLRRGRQSVHIFHIALAADWEHALAAGEYTVSTLGRTLAEEGFVHMSYADQWPGVLAAFYRDVPGPLVLLEVDPDRVGARVVVEPPPGAPGTEAFPHVYGPLPVAAVVAVHPDPRG